MHVNACLAQRQKGSRRLSKGFLRDGVGSVSVDPLQAHREAYKEVGQRG